MRYRGKGRNACRDEDAEFRKSAVARQRQEAQQRMEVRLQEEARALRIKERVDAEAARSTHLHIQSFYCGYSFEICRRSSLPSCTATPQV